MVSGAARFPCKPGANPGGKRSIQAEEEAPSDRAHAPTARSTRKDKQNERRREAATASRPCSRILPAELDPASLQESLQLAAAARVAQLAQRLGLDLPDALA